MSNKKKNLIIILLFLIFASLYLFWGLTQDNFEFFLKRRSKIVLAILLSSFCIGYSTVSFQTITNNRILTPSVIGLDSLYLFIQTFIVYAFGSSTLTMMTGYKNYFLSIGIMVIFSVILFLVLFKKEGRNIYFLVLTGMVIGNLFGGLSTFMQVLLDPNEFLIAQGRMFASFNNINSDLLYISLAIIFVMMMFCSKDFKYLDVLSLGREQAINLGINYQKFVLKNLIIISILVAVSTALTGPITFLGILVASISREVLKTYKHTERITGAVFIGAFALIAGQFILSRISTDTTISVVVNFIGGIYFIYLILREAKT
ncbi:MAG: iron chelate uptake ABC transporter family permease subunit [Eubacteriales bacterium]|nr:iron chelate uptake ABC transporter family permease subunit [Eubacteriales bacterium]